MKKFKVSRPLSVVEKNGNGLLMNRVMTKKGGVLLIWPMASHLLIMREISAILFPGGL